MIIYFYFALTNHHLTFRKSSCLRKLFIVVNTVYMHIRTHILRNMVCYKMFEISVYGGFYLFCIDYIFTDVFFLQIVYLKTLYSSTEETLDEH